MALENCSAEIQDCELQQLTDSQIFRKLLRIDGNCLYLNTGNNSFTALDVTNYSFNAANRTTVDTGLNTFKTNFPNATVISQEIVWNGATYDVFIRYKA